MVTPPTTPSTPTPTTIITSLRSPLRKSACWPDAGEAGELREQRGLHRLEQQDRDAGEEEADDEVGGDVALRRALGEHEPPSAAE